MFNEKDSGATVDASKDFLKEVNEMSDNIISNLEPKDNRTIDEIIKDQFIPIDNRTQQQRKDDDYLSYESDIDDKVTIEDVNDSKDDNIIFEDDNLTTEGDKNVTIEDDFDIDKFNKQMYRPADDRTVEEIIDDQFILTDDRTQQELEDNNYLSFESESESEIEDIDLNSAWDNKKTTVSKSVPIFKLSTDYNRKNYSSKQNKK